MPRGRPKKYATPEEARLKRIEKTKESNERIKLKKQQQGKGILGDLSNTITSGVLMAFPMSKTKRRHM